MTIRVLLVEDEPLLAVELADELAEAGFKVVGPASSTARALRLMDDTGCDAAVLDVNLGKETSEAVALALRESGTPFVVLSGYSSIELGAAFQGAPFLSKPVQWQQLVKTLNLALAVD